VKAKNILLNNYTMATIGQPSAGYKFNTFQEIKSHSFILYNERVAILFYLLDMRSISMNTYHNIADILEVRALIKQIYKNVRMLLRYNPTVRSTLNLETKDSGTYVTDVAIGMIDRMTEYCEVYGYTTKRIHIIVQELNNIEVLIKDVLQYFNYFIRPEFRQKPDIEMATEYYKEIADKKTVDELKQLVRKKHLINFEELGNKNLELLDGDAIENFDSDEESSTEEYLPDDPKYSGDKDDEIFTD
jgi:hypothetical protein